MRGHPRARASGGEGSPSVKLESLRCISVQRFGCHGVVGQTPVTEVREAGSQSQSRYRPEIPRSDQQRLFRMMVGCAGDPDVAFARNLSHFTLSFRQQWHAAAKNLRPVFEPGWSKQLKELGQA